MFARLLTASLSTDLLGPFAALASLEERLACCANPRSALAIDLMRQILSLFFAEHPN